LNTREFETSPLA